MIKKILFTLLVASIIYVYTGCNEDPISDPPVTLDTIAVNYNNLVVQERIFPFDLSNSAVDLYFGVILRDSSTIKDALLVDSLGLSQNFYFRSGLESLLDVPVGLETKFKTIFEYTNITQAQFDTISRIPESELTPSDFADIRTSTFTDPLSAHPVFGFYLTGRYPTFSTHHVYGMIYLDSVWRDNNGVFKLKFDVKINKNGENRFKTQ